MPHRVKPDGTPEGFSQAIYQDDASDSLANYVMRQLSTGVEAYLSNPGNRDAAGRLYDLPQNHTVALPNGMSYDLSRQLAVAERLGILAFPQHLRDRLHETGLLLDAFSDREPGQTVPRPEIVRGRPAGVPNAALPVNASVARNAGQGRPEAGPSHPQNGVSGQPPSRRHHNNGFQRNGSNGSSASR